MIQPTPRQVDSEGLSLIPPVTVDGHPIFVRLLDPQRDIAQVCQLFADVFGQPMPEERWRWKYMQAPGSSHYHAVAVHGVTGQLLGHMGVILLPGMRGGQPIRMAHATDLMISPQARAGIGPDSVYRHIMHAVRAHAGDAGPQAPALFMYGFPGKRPATLAIRLGIQRRLQICTQYTLPPPGHGLRHWWQHHNPWRLRAQAMPATEAAWSDSALNSIWQHHAQQLLQQERLNPAAVRPALIKNAAYLRWRYLQHPQQFAQGQGQPLYTLWLLARRGQAAQGWCITSAQSPTVVDSCLPGDADAVFAALQALPPPPDGQWTSWLPHPKAHAQETLIWATAMQGAHFYEDWLAPAFQPGDTDVY